MPLLGIPRPRKIARGGEAENPVVAPAPDGMLPAKGHFSSWPGESYGAVPLGGAVPFVGAGSVTVVAHVTDNVTGLTLLVATDVGFSAPVSSNAVASVGGIAKFSVSNLADDTLHYYKVQKDGIDVARGPVGQFRTRPPASFKVCFASCADTGSNHAVFDSIRNENPHFFIHMGDRHYKNIPGALNSAHYEAHERALSQSRQQQLFREVSTHYMWDDHDYGPNDSDGDFIGKANSQAVYRERVPHAPLEGAGAIYHSFDVGRVRFILTDQRSEASPNTDTDNASKTMLGAAQKTWFKNLIANSPGMLLVWVSTRVFHANAAVGGDHWGGFTTERLELANYIKANAPGRVIVLTGDRHQLGIDDGTNSNYAAGGDPLPTFMAAPLDQGTNTQGLATFSSGVFSGNGQYGVMDITDTGGATITVDWTGKNSVPATLATLSFNVTV